MKIVPRGFTLIEILVVIIIATILTTIIMTGFINFRKHTDLETSVQDGIVFILEARARSLSSLNSMTHGIHFDSGALVLFTGLVYNPADPSNVVRTLPSTVTISDILLQGGGYEIIFKKLTGDTDQYGTVTFELVSDSSQARTIDIAKSGLVSIQ